MDCDTPYTALAGKIKDAQELCLQPSPPGSAKNPFRSALEAQRKIALNATANSW